MKIDKTDGKGGRKVELREKIINAAIEEFQEKGLKLTMDDVAKRISISKKTLYQVFENKEDLFFAVTDYYFAEMKDHERKIMEDDSLDVLEKLRRIVIVLPERYQNIGLQNLYQLQEKFPGNYKKVSEYLDTDWDNTIALLEQGMNEGKLKKCSIPVVKAMVEGTIQHFMSSKILIDNQISFEEGLQEMIDIIMDGIVE